MADDTRTTGTIGQNAELAAAVSVDSLVDAPFWAINKIFGTDVPAPLHLGADVYQSQTDGLFLDSDGNPLDPDAVKAALATAEGRGAVLDAAGQSFKQAAANPLQLVPGWVWVAAGVVGVVVVGYYVVAAAGAVKTLKAA